MAKRSTVRTFVALFGSAVEAVHSIETSYGAASSAILAATLAAKEEKATPAEFENQLALVVAAAPGLALISVKGYASNARRIYACPADKLEEAKKAGGNSLQLVAKACPALQKAKAAAKTKEKTDDAPAGKAAQEAAKVPSAVTTPAVDPIVALANDLVAIRKLFAGKRAALALVGEMEDMLDDLKALAKAA